MENRSFAKWLLAKSEGNFDRLVDILQNEIAYNQNPIVWDLLEETGDTEYSHETFRKAAKIVVDAVWNG